MSNKPEGARCCNIQIFQQHHTSEDEPGIARSNIFCRFRGQAGNRIHILIGTVSCAHDGYQRLPGKVIHRRTWLFMDTSLEIIDNLHGIPHEATARLHWHPEVRTAEEVSGTSSTLPLRAGDREVNWTSNDVLGTLMKGTYHAGSGLYVPNFVIAAPLHHGASRYVTSWS